MTHKAQFPPLVLFYSLTGKTRAYADAQAARMGAVIIDSDELARKVVAVGTPGLAEIVELFGPEYLQADGSLDRAKLGELVFSDAQARQQLEAIVHPRVRELSAALVAEAPAESIVVQVIPLLLESGQGDDFDAVVVVDIDPELQLQRLMDRSSLTLEQAQARVAAQSTRDARLAIADHVINNDSDLAALQAQTTQIMDAIRKCGAL